ncbi:MAG: hypothetical protein KC662_03060, partial [Candidatus Magasanikbacteria bacterium]|nr:hypothetical protein [Candidatus Magasanikbacteria bacterium]
MHKLATYFLEGVKSVLIGSIVFIVASIILAPPSHAAPGVRANVTYQARLMDASGYPVVDGVYQIEFSLYDAAVAGNRLWSASGTTAVPLPVNVTVQDGLFTVLLGDGVTQLPFTDIDWNSDSLYLGVTIGADGEMSPRRPITAVPQAINSAQLGGMSPSSTDTYGGESQFTITQASTTAATSTRSALDVRSYGASAANDFAFRALTNAGTPAFTITSQGVVSSTNLIVAGQNVCLADGTDCLPGGIESDTLLSVTNRGSVATATLTLLGGAISNTLNVTDTATIANAVVTSTLTVSGTISSNLLPTTDLTYSLGTPSLRWNGSFGDVTIVNGTTTNATSTNFFAANAALGSLIANSGNITSLLGTNATFTSVTSTNFFASLVSSTQIIVNGFDVCTSDGVNCPAGTGSLQDAYDGGRAISLNDGHIELTSVTGTSADVFADNLGATFTRMIGGGVAGVTTTGFDILGYDDGFERGVVLSFSLDRDGISALSGESYLNSTSTANIRFNAGEFSQYLELSNNTSSLYLANDYIDLAINNGSDAKANMFVGPDGVFYFSAQGSNGFFDQTGYEFYNDVSAASVMQIISQNGGNGIWVGSDNDPNTQSYFPGAISDLLFRPNTTGGPGTQLYVNTDGTDTGWTGIATVDMLSGGLTATTLSRVGTSTSPLGVAYTMDVQGSLLFSVHNTYFANTHDWKLWDVSNKDVPVQVYATGSSALNYVNSGKLAGDRLYTVDTTSTKLSVFDISNPSLPILLGSMTGTSTPLSLEKKLVIEGSNVYMASEIGLTIINAKNPAAMSVTSFTSVVTPGGGITPVRMDAQDGYVYLSTKFGVSQPTSTITIIDARNINSPSVVDSFEVPAATFRGDDIAVSNEKLYIYISSGGSEYIRRYSIADRENPVLETTFPVNNGTGEFFVNKGLVITRDASSIMLYNEDGLLIDSSSSSHSGAITYEGGQIYASNFEGPTIKLAVYDIGGVNVNALNVANASIGSATVANNLTVNGRSSFVNGITVQGRGVCLSDGTNCPASGSGSLQSAYDLGRTVTTTNGGITLLSPTVGGTNLYPTADLDLKEIIGGGFEYDPNQGFGIAQYSSTTAAVSSGTMMYFSTDRSNPFGPSATSTFIISDLEIGAMYLGNPLTDNVLSLYNDSSSLVFDNFITLDAPTLNFIGDLDLQGTVTSDISPFSSLSFDLGISTARWRFGYFGTVSSTAVQAGSVTVGGQSVCLANGTNCLANGSLQSAYNIGKSITLNSGHIELTSVTGTSSDFLTEDFGATATRMIGGGIAGVTTTGFDIIGYDTGNGRGVELTFSSDRDGVNAPAGQSYLYGASTARISYLTDKFDNPSLLLSTNTSTITVGNDYLYFSIVDNGSSAANMSMDVDGLFN